MPHVGARQRSDVTARSVEGLIDEHALYFEWIDMDCAEYTRRQTHAIGRTEQRILLYVS